MTLEKLEQVVTAGFGQLNGRMDATNERLDKLAVGQAETNARLDAANERLDATNERLDATNERLDATNERLDVSNVRLDQLTVGQAETNKRLGQVDRTMHRSFETLADLLRETNQGLERLGGRFDNMVAYSGREVRQLRTDVDNLQERVKRLEPPEE